MPAAVLRHGLSTLAAMTNAQWADLCETGRRALRRFGTPEQAQDDVQAALVRFLEEQAKGNSIQDATAWIVRVARNFAASRQRAKHVWQKHVQLYEKSEFLQSVLHYYDPAKLMTFDEKAITETEARELAQALLSYLKALQLTGPLLHYVFAQAVLFSGAPQFQRGHLKALAASISGALPSSLDRECRLRGITRQSKGQTTLPPHLQTQLNRVMADLEYRGISLHHLYAALRTPRIVLSCEELAMMVAPVVQATVEQILHATKACRFDILLRSGLERQDLTVDKLPAFVQGVDTIFMAARMPREYILFGSIMYLQRLFGAPSLYADVIDHNFAEHFLRDIINRTSRICHVDKWLAIINLGILYELMEIDIDHVAKILSPIESKILNQPLQKIGIGFAWIDAAGQNKQHVMQEKIYRLFKPEHWHGGLALLPLTISASYMGQSPAALQEALECPELWLPVLHGLQSASYIAILGALGQLTQTPFHEPPPSVKADLAAALRRVRESHLPLIRARVALVPRQYWGDR